MIQIKTTLEMNIIFRSTTSIFILVKHHKFIWIMIVFEKNGHLIIQLGLCRKFISIRNDQ